jgi:hypothetical protein
MLSDGSVDSRVRLSLPFTPSRVTVRVSSMPSRSDAAAPGWERSSSGASVRSGPERFGPVDHDEHALLDVEAPRDQVRQQAGRDRLVLGRALPPQAGS